MQLRLATAFGLAGVVLAAGCGLSPSTPTSSAPTTDGASSTTSSTSTTSGSGDTITNTWVGPPADLTKLPIGTSHVSTTRTAVGGVFACDSGNPNGGGAGRPGPWINEATGTWNANEKVSVQGSVAWPMARYSEAVEGIVRKISSNGLPVDEVTGNFPIAASDPAYAYDGNPNSIAATTVSKSLPVAPAAAAAPGCLGKGPIGVLKNGVVLFAPLDERNRDAVVYETQDDCDGHPQQQSQYHYHDVPSCVVAAATGTSTVVGFAYDGYPIVVERNAAGELPTNADLDVCHGRTSPVLLDGNVVTTYHYSATHEFPYSLGCYHGKQV